MFNLYLQRYFTCVVVFLLCTDPLIAQKKPKTPDEPTIVGGDIDNLVLRQWHNEDKTKTDNLCLGDKLLEWDGQPLKDNDDLVRRWLANRAGQTSRVKVERIETVDGKPVPRILEVTLLHEAPSELYKDALFG
ncbi:MAG: hypothetical protein ABL888_17330, partial [Pirellulaceae bacterium]